MSHDLTTYIERYKKTVASRYRMVRPDDFSHIPSGPLWISPKIDGELWFAELTPHSVRLVARNGRELPEECALFEQMQAAKTNITGYTILAGELFDSQGSPRPRVGGVSAALGKRGDLNRLAWNAFDAIIVNDNEAPSDFGERIQALTKILGTGTHKGVVPFVHAESRSEVRNEWSQWVESDQAEGLVIRTSDARIYKMKPQRTVDAVIIAYTVRAGEEEMARSILLGLVNENSTFNIIGAVGSLGSIESKKDIGRQLSALECNSSFRYPSSEGGLYRFVRPEIVVEVTCLDIQTEDSSGAAIDRFQLAYEDEQWRALRRRPTVSLITPVFERIRTDKSSTSPADVGIDQVVSTHGRTLRDYFDLAGENEDGDENQETPSAEIKRREVWTKVTKGELSVRKLTVCRTHKEAVYTDWPRWVVHMTDYSPSRKNPLERFVRFAWTEDAVERIVELMLEKYIKKGLNKVE